MKSIADAPAHYLEGLTLASGWNVGQKYVRSDGLSAGKYSVGYFVERDGQKGFLKAIDYSRANDSAVFVEALLKLTQAFEFERSILKRCQARKMDRVISAIEDGELIVGDGPLRRVNYLIFARADGDIRKTLAEVERFEVALRLRILHHVTTGLCQLHNGGIAHQDLKPSNVLTFGNISKVSDLGSASVRGTYGPRDDELRAGDGDYAPPELLYGQNDPDFVVKRFGCDSYLLGSLTVFLFTAVGMTSGILSHLPAQFFPEAWGGTYADVLTYVEDAFLQAVSEFASQIRGEALRSELREIVTQLCDPDPSKRGHPLNRRQKVGNPYGLERYRSIFDRLATRASFGLLR